MSEETMNQEFTRKKTDKISHYLTEFAKYYKNSRTGESCILESSPSYRNYILAIPAKIYGNTDTKVFWSLPVFRDLYKTKSKQI